MTSDQITVTACQGCWWGSGHEVDGDVPLCGLNQRADVRTAAVSCHDVCNGDSVTVVEPSQAGRRAGGRPVMLRDTHLPEVRALLEQWFDAGGPGLSQPPVGLIVEDWTGD